MIRARIPIRPLAFLFLVPVVLPGCITYGVSLEGPIARRVEQEGRLQAISFTSTVEAHGMAGEQLIYAVRVFDRHGRPIQSADGQYEMEKGQVGARTSLMIATSPQIMNGVSARIPVRELHLRADYLPAFAEISVLDRFGNRLATRRMSLPITSMMEVTPPLEIPEKEDQTFWFVRDIGPWSGAFWGPVTSANTARTLADIAEEPAVLITSSQYLWIVSFESMRASNAEFRIACLTEELMNRFLEIEAPRFEAAGEWKVGIPVKLRMERLASDRRMFGIYTEESARDHGAP